MANPAFIKYLGEQGIPNKVICLISRAQQSYVSKVLGGAICKNIEPSNELVNRWEAIRFNVVLYLYTLPVLKKNKVAHREFNEEDAKYIHLLKVLLIPKEIIYSQLYSWISKTSFNLVYSNEEIDFRTISLDNLDINQFDFEELFDL